MLHIPGLYIGRTEARGRGVFTAGALSAGDVIESCPVLLLPADDRKRIHASRLHDYYLEWPDGSGRIAIMLGYGSLYNHGRPANARLEFDLEGEGVSLFATRDIEAGEELLIDYREGEQGTDGLWFEPM